MKYGKTKDCFLNDDGRSWISINTTRSGMEANVIETFCENERQGGTALR